jgi:hypothetical protein
MDENESSTKTICAAAFATEVPLCTTLGGEQKGSSEKQNFVAIVPGLSRGNQRDVSCHCQFTL